MPDHLSFMLMSGFDDNRPRDGAERTRASRPQSGLIHQHGIRRLSMLDADGGLVGILTLDRVLESLTGEQNRLVGLMAREQRQEREYRR